MAIGSIFSYNNGPIQGYRQHLLVESLGPFMAIDNILQHHQWVQSRVLAAYLYSILLETLGPFVAIGSIFSAASMGHYEHISSICWGKHWAHSCSSAKLFGKNNGPIQSYQQHLLEVMLAHSIISATHLGCYMGPFKAIEIKF